MALCICACVYRRRHAASERKKADEKVLEGSGMRPDEKAADAPEGSAKAKTTVQLPRSPGTPTKGRMGRYRARGEAQAATEAVLAEAVKVEVTTQEELERIAEAEAAALKEAESKKAQAAAEALARLQEAQGRNDELAVEEELARGALPVEIALRAEMQLNDQRSRAKRVADASAECAKEVDAAESELRELRIGLSRLLLESAAEDARMVEEIEELQEDVEQLRFEEENFEIASESPGKWKSRHSASTDIAHDRQAEEKMRWMANVERTKHMVESKRKLLEGAIEMWEDELYEAEEVTADVQQERDDVAADLEAEREKWKLWTSQQDDAVQRRQNARVEQERTNWGRKSKEAREELQRALEAKKANVVAWSAAVEATRDEVDVLDLLRIDIGRKITSTAAAKAEAEAEAEAVRTKPVGSRIAAFVNACESPKKRDSGRLSKAKDRHSSKSPERSHEAEVEYAAEKAAAAHEAALRVRVQQIKEKQRANAYNTTGTTRSLPSAMALPAPSCMGGTGGSCPSAFSPGPTGGSGSPEPKKGQSAQVEADPSMLQQAPARWKPLPNASRLPAPPSALMAGGGGGGGASTLGAFTPVLPQIHSQQLTTNSGRLSERLQEESAGEAASMQRAALPLVSHNLQEEGTLHVHLKKGTGLKAADRNGLSDPYLKLSLGAKLFKSTTIKKTLSPEWCVAEQRPPPHHTMPLHHSAPHHTTTRLHSTPHHNTKQNHTTPHHTPPPPPPPHPSCTTSLPPPPPPTPTPAPSPALAPSPKPSTHPHPNYTHPTPPQPQG